jgi:S1-C subfamily serine protease
MGISVGASQDDREYDGALVMSVVEDGPADEAGIREGDVITAVRGQSLLEPLPDIEDEERLDLYGSVPVQRLLSLSRQLEPGETVPVTYLRDGTEHTTELVAEDLGSGFRVIGGNGAAFRWDEDDWSGDNFRGDFHFEMPNVQIPSVERLQALAPLMGLRGGLHGLQLTPLNPALGEYFGAEEGVLVLEVDGDSTLGLQAGDVLLDIDGRSVRDQSHAWRILGSYESGETVSFRIMRHGSEQTVEGELPRRRSRRRGLRN